MCAVRMPFGKHKGRLLADIPEDYLLWLLDNADLRPALQKAVEVTLYGPGYDEGWQAGFAAGRQAAIEIQRPPASGVGDVVRRWYRQASIRFHPDRGGDVRLMTAVNELKDGLLAAIEPRT